VRYRTENDCRFEDAAERVGEVSIGVIMRGIVAAPCKGCAGAEFEEVEAGEWGGVAPEDRYSFPTGGFGCVGLSARRQRGCAVRSSGPSTFAFKSSFGYWSVVVVAVVTVAALAVPAVPAGATSGTLMIGADTTLTEDHSGDIVITADNVTLDCDGHTVTGAGAGLGIVIGINRSGVTVTDCEVTNFTDGIHVTESDDITLIGNNAHHNSSVGIILNLSNGNTLTGNQVNDNGFGKHATFGFLLLDSDDNELTNNSANRNGETNFGLERGPNGSDGNTFTQNTASGGDRGFALPSSNNNTFHANTVTDVGVHGFESDALADNNVFTDNMVAGSGAQGFRMGGKGNSFTGNDSHQNGGWGFEDFSVPGSNTYSDNRCFGNSLGGSSPSGLCLVGDTVGLVDPLQGQWHLRNEAGAVTSFFYGNPGDLPIAGDWDGDGDATPGLYRQSDGFFYSRNSNTTGIADAECFAGDPSDVPIAGDWDGDGDDNLGIYRPSEQMFYLFTSTCTGSPMGAAQISFLFGNPGDNPVAGDWDGDGIDEVGLHRESTGFFYWRNTLDTGVADGEIFFGDPGDRFVSGDWGTVDGKDTPGLFRPSDVTFYFRHTLTQGVADSQFTWTGAGSSWLPVAGDFGLG
jgi:parallel beta-helix repeat protein